MRKKIVAGNWKMNLNLGEGYTLVAEILSKLPSLSESQQVIIAPPFLHTQQTITQTQYTPFVSVASQTCHHETSGAFTGEISATMLKDAGVRYTLVGHSERRAFNSEDNALLAKKTSAALDAGIDVIFCCGESLDIRDAEQQNDYVAQQLKESLFHLDAKAMSNIVIAYEPIWAIGTGRTASAQQAQDMHQHIRSVLVAQYGQEVAQNTSILYGGSCKASNAAELFAGEDVDGGLIGGAALVADDFIGIIKAMIAAK
ncbi:MAG: triose-phosphate isomerase [Chitinophagaceae bacterium]|nr:triose-phosphate isomerase [Chitinophagaceae bacterium]